MVGHRKLGDQNVAHAALPLEGLKVVEVATWIAAPVAATILADLGADVIKIEPPGDGDPYRGLPEFLQQDLERSALRADEQR